jgi:hypothetical protein
MRAFVLVAFGLLPALSFVDRWDSYLSFSLYSGNTREATIVIDAADWERLPPFAREVMETNEALDPYYWAMSELGVTSYPEDRIALNIAHTLARRVSHAPVGVWLRSKPHALTGERKVRIWMIPAGDGPEREMTEEAE